MPTSLPTMTTLKRRRNARLKQAKLDAKVWKPWGKDMPEDGRSFLAYCSFNKSQYMVVLERWKNLVGTEIVSIRLWPDGKDATHDFTHWRPCVGGPIVEVMP